MKPTCMLVVVSLLATACQRSNLPEIPLTPLRDDAVARVRAQAEELKLRMQAGDMKAVMEVVPDAMIPGGAAARQASLKQAEAMADTVRAIGKFMNYQKPRPIRSAIGRHLCVLPYASKLGGKPMKACHIAISEDGGATWGFISGGSSSVANLRRVSAQMYAAIEDDIQVVSVAGKTR